MSKGVEWVISNVIAFCIFMACVSLGDSPTLVDGMILLGVVYLVNRDIGVRGELPAKHKTPKT